MVSAGWAAKPNVIFLLSDDQTFDSLGCYGNPDVQTPHVDALSKAGLTFDNYYNTTAICMASRANILTGMYEYKHGCNFNKGHLSQEKFAQTYPMLMRKAGYLTAMAGKIGIEVTGVGLPKDSFDWWGAGPGQTHFRTAKNKSMAKYAKEFPHSSRAYGAFGRDFVKHAASEGKPFCLSISFKAPHRPVDPDPKFDHIYEGKTFRKPANYGRDYGKHFSEQSRQGRQYSRFESWGYKDDFDATLAKYHQLCYAVDIAVGMICEAVEEAGVADNTIIIYTSDNGFFNGAHGYGSKVLPYEESARAPMIIYHPGMKSTHGKRSGSLSGNIDVAPTLLELAGISAPNEMDGVSMIPILADKKAEVRNELALMNCWGPHATQSLGVHDGRYKYIYWYYGGHGMTPAEELYDLSEDRLEMFNVAKAAEHQEALMKMRGLYDQRVKHLAANVRGKYTDYATLFDRNASWEKKAPLVPKRLAPGGK